jgi:hypothetical protein
MKPSYNKKLQVEIEVWVTPRDEAFGGNPPIASEHYGEWKASVRHSNGEMGWQWCKTFEEAVAWCERFAQKPS